MIFTKGRIIGLICTVATLIGAMVVLHNINADNELARLDSVLKADVLGLLFLLYGAHFLAEPLRWVAYSYHPAFTPSRQAADQIVRSAESNPGTGFFTRIFACFNITALLSYSLPFKLGLPLRLFLLSHFLKLDTRLIIKLMTLDGVLNLLSWMLVSAGLFLLVPEFIRFFSVEVNVLVLLTGIVVCGLAVVWLVKKKGVQVLAMLRSIPVGVVVFVIFTLVVDIVLYGVRHMVLAEVLGIDIRAELVFIIGILAVFAGIMSTLPMGLGAYDASLAALLALYGVDLEVSLMLAFCNRLSMILTSIILGLPSSLALIRKDIKVAVE